MKKNMLGYTLIELIGAIVLLGIISTITFRVVGNIIENSKEAALKETISNLESAAHLYRTQNRLESKKYDVNENSISFKELLENGYIENLPIDPYEDELLSGCVMYSWEGTQYEFRYDENCKNIKPKLIDMDIVFNSLEKVNTNGWHNNDFYVKITVSGDSYKWCSGIGECEPVSLIENNEGEVLINTQSRNNRICVIGYDEGNYSSKICSKAYKLDKIKPVFTNIEDEKINKDDIIDLASNIVTKDGLSGIDGTYSYYPNNLDTSVPGTINVKYSVKDLAGNESEIEKKVIITAEPPHIQYVVLDNVLNDNGWAKEDFYVKADIIDQSGLGIKSAKWCITTDDTCEPNADVVGSSMTPLINVESDNNRICIEAIDNNDVVTQVVCSDAYKLDKTKPVPGSIDITGTLGTNDWYTSDVAISSIDGSDSLSGHSNTTVDVSNINNNTRGVSVTLTTKDKAGNSSSINKIVKVDKNNPSILPKSLFFSINKGDSVDFDSFFDVSYSISGGELVCTPENTNLLESDQQMIYCEAVGNNGLTNSATKDIIVKSAVEILIANKNNNKIYAYDFDGNLAWEKEALKYAVDYREYGINRTRYESILDDKVVTSHGEMIVANENANKIYKYDIDGNLVWEKEALEYGVSYKKYGKTRIRYESILDDRVLALDGGLIVLNENANKIYKYDTDGNLVFEKEVLNYGVSYRKYGKTRTRYESILDDEVIVLSDGGLIVANKNADRIYKYNPEGNLVWEKEYLDDRVLASLDGGFIVINENANKIYKYDFDGNLIWDKEALEYTVNYKEYGQNRTRYKSILDDKIIASSDGGLIVANEKANRIYKYDIDGKLVWDKETLNYTGQCGSYYLFTIHYEDCDKTILDDRVLASSDGGLMVINKNSNKMYKYDFDGNLIWEKETLKYIGQCKVYNYFNTSYEICDKTILDDKVFGY